MSGRPVLVAAEEGGTILVRSPSVGAVIDLPEVGSVIVGGSVLGAIETLSQREAIVAPAALAGRVVERLVRATTRANVGYGTPMLRLDPRIGGESFAQAGRSESIAELVFRAPMSGRFYVRPAPTKPPLVEVGQVLEVGQGIGLLEVMKTFHRVVYGGEGVPERARVLRVVPADGDDVLRASVLLELEPV